MARGCGGGSPTTSAGPGCRCPAGWFRARWTTPVDGWTTLDGRSFPGATRATWHLPDGPFTYVEGAFVPSRTTFDAWPGTAGVPGTAALAAAPGP